MDNFFSSPDLFDDLTKEKINCCGTVKPNRMDMPQDLGHNKIKLKRGDIRLRTRDDLTAVVRRDKRDVHMLTNIHNPCAEGGGKGNAMKVFFVQDYNHQTVCVDKIGWPIAIQSAAALESGQRNYYPIYYMWLFVTVTFFRLVVERKSHIGNFDLPIEKHAGQQSRVHRPRGKPADVFSKVSRPSTGGSKH
jgi:hypothetical protein